MAADLQSVNAALVNLDARLTSTEANVIEARKDAKDADDYLGVGGQILQRDVGASVANFKFDAKNEFDRQHTSDR